MTDAALQYAVERLLARYAAAIDDDRLEEWPHFFTPDCRYQIISRENYDKKLPVGIFFANSRAMLEDRVNSLREANIYEAQHYRHILSPSLVTEPGAGFVRAQTNYQVIRIMHDGATMIFSTGRYLDRIALATPEPLFQEKLVLMDSRRVDTLLAIPL
ncbi:MAG TPA: aromatic-ring-hydroxylating dioxygenase subunit beta [Stellaceae bacterium]|nr:aromatic-ring-hydroxylating dioxygenase subunit beta [Stellaceae bacterium]